MIKFKNIEREIPSYTLSVINTLKCQDTNWLGKKDGKCMSCWQFQKKTKYLSEKNHITMYKESHSTITKESLYSEESTILKFYQPSNRVSKYMKQKKKEL